MAAIQLLEPVKFLINLPIRKSKFPARWKLGKLILLYKGKGLDRYHPASYRPVSVLPVIGKMAERAIQEQLIIGAPPIPPTAAPPLPLAQSIFFIPFFL